MFEDQVQGPSEHHEEAAYIAYNNVPMGVTHYQGRLFITVPRRRPGIPATLNYVPVESKITVPSPLLRGYPDYETNALDVSLSSCPLRG